jgi:hypothetical protein
LDQSVGVTGDTALYRPYCAYTRMHLLSVPFVYAVPLRGAAVGGTSCHSRSPAAVSRGVSRYSHPRGCDEGAGGSPGLHLAAVALTVELLLPGEYLVTPTRGPGARGWGKPGSTLGGYVSPQARKQSDALTCRAPSPQAGRLPLPRQEVSEYSHLATVVFTAAERLLPGEYRSTPTRGPGARGWGSPGLNPRRVLLGQGASQCSHLPASGPAPVVKSPGAVQRLQLGQESSARG